MPEAKPPLRFIADEQLGRLSRWLKIVGQDVIYRNRWPDEELLSRARAEGRIILTRDSHLPAKAEGLSLYWVRENYPARQLREVVSRFRDQIRIEVFSRCVECNVPLHDIARPEVEGKVPPFVWKTQTEYRACPACGKIFWSATHRERIEVQLQDILGELYQDRSA
jgi:hypothetical protein